LEHEKTKNLSQLQSFVSTLEHRDKKNSWHFKVWCQTMQRQMKKKRLKNNDLILVAISTAKIFWSTYYFQGLLTFAFEKLQ